MTRSPSPSARRALLVFGLPIVALLALAVLPLATGARTLVLRDVLSTHLLLESAPAAALAEGWLPVLDPARGGGQPHTGNPNALPFYPTALLYAAAPVLWALNAHFWLHLLIAPAAGYLLGRAWGLAPGAAWATGATYAASGFFLSQMSFYNLVAGAALAPALVAAALFATAPEATAGAGRRRRWRWAAAAGALWGLLLVAGEPLVAAAALGLAGLAVALRPRPAAAAGERRSAAGTLGALGAALAAGTALALPQIVELARVYPTSFRAARGALLAAGAGGGTGAAGSWHPLRALEWLLPWAFGRFDVAGGAELWRAALDPRAPPFFLSLAPGLIALALVAVSGLPARRRSAGAGEPAAPARPAVRGRTWAWVAIAGGVFTALGVHNPVLGALSGLPGAGGLRYPEKLWLAVALGGALLAGIGFERTVLARRLRPLAVALGLLAVAAVGVAAVVALAPEAARRWLGGEGTLSAGAVPPPWTAISTLSLLVLALAAGALALGRRRPVAGGALLLAVHVASQVVLLRPLLATDAAVHYRQPASPLAAALPAGARVVHGGWGGAGDLFPGTGAPTLPGTPVALLTRRAWSELAPFAGAGAGLRYQMVLSPEGLDSLAARVARDLVRAAPSDRHRVGALARLGAEYLLLPRPLSDVPTGEAELVRRETSGGRTIHLYRLSGAVPEVRLAQRVVPVEGPAEAFRVLAASAFAPAPTPIDWDPRRDAGAVVGRPGPGAEPAPRPRTADGTGREEAGSARIVAAGPERLEVEVDSPAGAGFLVAARSYLPVWRATVDGRRAATVVADVHRLAVPVPPGRHRVVLEVDRRPLALAAVGALVGALGLLGLLGAGLVRRRA